MTISAFSSGTQTCTVGTEHDLANINVVGEFRLGLDFVNSAAGDFFEIRGYKKLLTSGSERLFFIEGVAGDQTGGIILALTDMWIPNDITDSNSLRFTIKQVTGTSRQVAYKCYIRNDEADVTKIGGSTAILALFKASVAAGVSAVATGTPTATTVRASALASTHDDQYNGRTIFWTSGALVGSFSEITDYTNSTREFTFAAVHTAATAGDTFVIL